VPPSLSKLPLYLIENPDLTAPADETCFSTKSAEQPLNSSTLFCSLD